ncbi:MAG: bifunctional DNA-formamidopyrimidine glycosylase/DNA-(apurinic or apyrimidinic site) lyase [Duodenibacillus sp.]
MPELPEVEVTRKGLAPYVEGARVRAIEVRTDKLRRPLEREALASLAGARITRLERRGKYLIWRLADDLGEPLGAVVSHLGMSGYWRVWPDTPPTPGRHEHIDWVLESAAGTVTVRLTDPRKFSDFVFVKGEPLEQKPLSDLGPEPWDETLTPERFAAALKATRRPVKEALLAGNIVVGCGNIYASESLFLAGIDPRRRADRISAVRAAGLLTAVRETLAKAIAAGGSTLRDFHGPDGADGYFALQTNVYGREGLPCRRCGTPVRRIVQGTRSTYFCPHCQH